MWTSRLLTLCKYHVVHISIFFVNILKVSDNFNQRLQYKIYMISIAETRSMFVSGIILGNLFIMHFAKQLLFHL